MTNMTETISHSIKNRKDYRQILADFANHYKADTRPLIHELLTVHKYTYQKIADLMGISKQALQDKYEL